MQGGDLRLLLGSGQLDPPLVVGQVTHPVGTEGPVNAVKIMMHIPTLWTQKVKPTPWTQVKPTLWTQKVKPTLWTQGQTNHVDTEGQTNPVDTEGQTNPVDTEGQTNPLDTEGLANAVTTMMHKQTKKRSFGCYSEM